MSSGLWVALISMLVVSASLAAPDKDPPSTDETKGEGGLTIPGSSYRGPSDTVQPPAIGEPPPPGGEQVPSGPPGNGRGGAAGRAGGTPPTAPNPRPPSTGGVRSRTQSPRTGGGIEADTWQTWWRNNGDPYLHQWRPIPDTSFTSDPGMLTGSTPWKRQASPSRVPSSVIRSLMMPELASLMRDEQITLAESAVIALCRATPQEATATIESLLEPLLSDSRIRIRDATLLGIGLLGDTKAAPQLFEILLDSAAGRNLTQEQGGVSLARRGVAAIGLGLMHASDSVAMMLDLFQTTNSAELKMALLIGAALAAPDSTALASCAIKAIRSESEDRRVRAQAAIALSRQPIVGRAALADLVRILEDEDVPGEIRISAAIALGALCKSSDTVSIQALVRRLQDGGEPRVRHASWIALGRILEHDPPSSRAPEAREPLVHVLLREAQHPSRSGDQAWAALALGIALREDPRDSKLRRLVSEKLNGEFLSLNDPDRISALALALGLLGRGDGTEALLARLSKKPSEDESVYLLQALALSQDPTAIDALTALVRNPKSLPRVRIEGARALGVLRDISVIEELQRQLERSRSQQDVASYAGALGALCSEAAIAPLLALLKDLTRPAQSRAQAALALSYLAERTPSSWFTAVSVDSNYHVRCAAIDVFLQ